MGTCHAQGCQRRAHDDHVQPVRHGCQAPAQVGAGVDGRAELRDQAGDGIAQMRRDLEPLTGQLADAQALLKVARLVLDGPALLPPSSSVP